MAGLDDDTTAHVLRYAFTATFELGVPLQAVTALLGRAITALE
jgi:site-specific recombinase XerD